MARNLQEQGKHKESLVFFDQALKLDPRAFIYYRMAQALQAGNAKAKAIAAYEAALSSKPALNDKQRSDAQAQLKQLKS
jgi:tetratricopeptide (TPR) repeat protein